MIKVYAPNPAQWDKVFSLTIAPAAHLEGETPAEWTDEEGKPRNMSVVFNYGEAIVTSEIGRYLIAHGLARKTKLILPADLAA